MMNMNQGETKRAAQEGDLPPLLTDERLRAIHHEDEFGLFCDFDEFHQIARAIESEVRTAIAAAGGGVPQVTARPDILERLSYHALERDDLTLDECLDYLAKGWAKVHGRTERQMVMQILALLASSPQPEAAPAVAQVPKDVLNKCKKALLEYTQAPENYHAAVLRMRDALRDLLAAAPEAQAQADPTDPGYDVEVLREHVRHLERRVRQLSQAAPAVAQVPQGCGKLCQRYEDGDGQLCGSKCAAATEAPAQAEATDWILAMGHALGLDSGYSVPIVPSVDEFKRLFAEIRRRAVAEGQQAAPSAGEVERDRKDAERWRTFIGLDYKVRAEWAVNLSLVPVLTEWVDAALSHKEPKP